MTLTYDPETFTYGAELEYGDWYVRERLPAGTTWNQKDYTIVSSNGIANDPKGIVYEYGGEINTKPADSITAAVQVIEDTHRSMITAAPVVNYRSNLHIHVRVPGLKDDLAACKRLQIYISKFMPKLFELIEPIPKPVQRDYPSEGAWDGAMKRYKRRLVSHQQMMSPARVKAMLAATTTDEFWKAHAVTHTDGRVLWHLSTRAAINLRQMWEETNTIEFRHFPGTLDLSEYECCFKWCEAFLTVVLNELGNPDQIFKRVGRLKLPKFKPYNHQLEQMYEYTTPGHHNYTVLKERFAALRARGVL